MRKYLTALLVIVASGAAVAQVVTYLDAKGKPAMYATTVGNGQTVYTDGKGNTLGYASTQPVVSPVSVPNIVFPMVEPSYNNVATQPLMGVQPMQPMGGLQ